MRRTLLLPLIASIVSMVLGGCAINPTHPSLKEASLPELIPVREFVADRKWNGVYRISPDGKKLAWIGVDGTRPAVMVKTIGQDKVKAFPALIRYFTWAGDSKHLLIVADNGGDENTHIFVGTAEGEDTTFTDLTPFEKTVAHIVRVVVIENRRDKKVFDLFTIDLAIGKHTSLATNPGSVAKWGVDRHGRLLARILQDGERHILQSREPGTEDSWKDTVESTIADQPVTVAPSSKSRRANLPARCMTISSTASTGRFNPALPTASASQLRVQVTAAMRHWPA